MTNATNVPLARIFALVTTALLLAAPAALAQEPAYLVTYGPGAPSIEGDPDHVQVLFFRVPDTYPGRVQVLVYDMDTGGDLDAYYGSADTRTRFTILGGEGATTNPGVRQATPTDDALYDGRVLAEETIGVDQSKNDAWYGMDSVAARDGEHVNGHYVFKVVVQGVAGNDGNVFRLRVITATMATGGTPPSIDLFAYAPTVRAPTSGSVVEMPLELPPDAPAVIVHNFDAAGATVRLDTRFESHAVEASGQDRWVAARVALAPEQRGTRAAVTLRGGQEMPNDASFYVSDDAGELLQLQMPASEWPFNRRPNPAIDVQLLEDCRSVAFSAAASTDAEDRITDYEWDFGDERVASGPEAVHRYPDVGIYEAILRVDSDSQRVGSGSLLTRRIVVNALPVARAGSDLIAAPGEVVSFDGSASADPDGSLVSHTWDFGDGNTANGAAVTHAFERPGRFRVRLDVLDDSPWPARCGGVSDDLEIWVNAPPVPDAGVDRTIAIGETLTLDAGASRDDDGEIVSYRWDFGAGTVADSAVAEHSWETPGRYEVRLTIQDDAGARNSIAADTMTVVVNAPPRAAASAPAVVAAGDTVNFDATASFDSDGTLVDYHWEFGDGRDGVGAQTTHVYSAPGLYEVELRVRDDSGVSLDSDTTTLTVRVNEPPVAIAGADIVTTTGSVTFDGSSSSDGDGRVVAYAWDFGDGATSISATPTHVFRAPGTYEVTLTVTDDSGTGSATSTDALTVLVNAPPIADAGPDRTVAPGQTVTFDGTASSDPDGSVASWDWDLGDGTTASGREVSHAYEEAGLYTVRLEVRDETGNPRAVDFDSLTVRVNAPPVADAGPALRAAPGEPVVLDATGSFDGDAGELAYRWDPGDGSAALEGATATHAFSSPGVYDVTLTVEDSSGAVNGTARDRTTVHVNHTPQSVAGPDITTWSNLVEFDGGASVDGDGDVLSYTWDFGDGSPAVSGRRVSHIYAEGGSYPVVLTVDDGTGLPNSSSASSLTAWVKRAPIAIAGDNRTVCRGDVVLFDGAASIDPESGLLKYDWDFGDGSEAEGVNPTHRYQDVGVYPVTLTVRSDSVPEAKTHADRIVVRVTDTPVADAGPDRRVCAYTEVILDGTGSTDFDGVVNRYLWDFGDGTTGAGATPRHVFEAPGEYIVRLTIEGEQVAQCDYTDTDEVLVTVVAAPAPLITAPEAVPVGTPVDLIASTTVESNENTAGWNWDFGDGTTGQGTNVSHVYEEPGRYVIRLTVNAAGDLGCPEVATQAVIVVNGPPTAEAGADQLVGVGQEVVFDASESTDPDGAISSYEWDFGDGETATGMVVRHRYRAPGSYTARLAVLDDAGLANSSAADSLTVQVNDAPLPQITADVRACVADDLVFSADRSSDSDGSIESYFWDFGDGVTAEGVEAAHSFRDPGRYEVVLRVSDDASVANSRAESTTAVTINRPPVADGGADRLVCPAVPLTFDASRSLDWDGRITAYRWEFGDGAGADGVSVEHAFADPGRYDVRLMVTDDGAAHCSTAEDTVGVRVNASPIADAGDDIEAFLGAANDAILFDATGSSDPDDPALTYTWDFGDGGTGRGARVYHEYAAPGTYRVRLSVDDGTGLACGRSFDEITVRVTER